MAGWLLGAITSGRSARLVYPTRILFSRHTLARHSGAKQARRWLGDVIGWACQCVCCDWACRIGLQPWPQLHHAQRPMSL